jgi:hypothetical protein
MLDYYLRVVILMLGFIELGNPAGIGLTLSRRSHLRGNTPNKHHNITFYRFCDSGNSVF